MALNEIILSTISESFRNSVRKVAPTIEEYVISLYNGGLDKTAIRNLLLGPRGEELIFGPLRKAFGNTSKTNMERVRQFVRNEEFKNVERRKLFRWVLDPGKEHCPTCIDRASMGSKLYEEWELIGLPQSGVTECGEHCWCSLKPE